MTLRNTDVSWKHIKSYATEENLMKHIGEIKDTHQDNNDRFFVVRTPEGRWTAIVQIDKNTGGYLGRYDGFLKV